MDEEVEDIAVLRCPSCSSDNVVENELGYGAQAYERYGDEWTENSSHYLCGDCGYEIKDSEVDDNTQTKAEYESDEMCKMTKKIIMNGEDIWKDKV